MIYELKEGEPAYPQILSEDDEGSPIPWSALSGMVWVPWQEDTLLAVWDSAFSTSNILRIDVSEKPAVITASRAINPGALAPAPTIRKASPSRRTGRSGSPARATPPTAFRTCCSSWTDWERPRRNRAAG